MPSEGPDVQIQRLTAEGQIAGQVVDGEEGKICVRVPSSTLGYNKGGGEGELELPRTEVGWYRTGDLGRHLRARPGAA